jgi:O-antigen/teichoic acid export membrane protein
MRQMQNISELLKRDYTRNFFKLFSSLLFAQGLSFALSPLLSRLYTPEEFGLVALYTAIGGLIGMVATGKYEQAIMLPAKNEEAAALISLVLLLTLGFSILYAVLLLLFHHNFVAMTSAKQISFWLWFLPFTVLLHGVFQSFNYISNRLKLFGAMANATIVQYVVLNFSRIAIGISRYSWNGLIIAQLLSPMFASGFIVLKVLPKVRSFFKPVTLSLIREQGKKYSQYPTYNLVQSLTNNLASSLPVFMFTGGFSAQTAGLYAFGYTFVFKPLSLFSQSTLQVLSQKIIEDHHNQKDVYPGLHSLAFQLFKLGIVPFTILGVFAPVIFSFIFSPEWEESGRMIQILMPWLFMVFITSPMSFIPELFFQQKKAMIIDIISVIMKFGALYTGIHFQDINLALALFSLSGFLIVTYSLIWYLKLARDHKKLLHSQGER